MVPEASPFTPGQPVPIEFFVGRIAEIEHLRSLVRASVNGRFKIGFVTGERGIGKSSLVSFLRHLAEREESVAGAHVFLGGAAGLPDMVKRTFDRILKESIEKPWHNRVSDFFGQHVRKVGLFGITVELNLSQDDLRSVVQDFAPALRQLVSQLKNDGRALLLILDDINGLASSAEFANWLKSVVDQIATGTDGLAACVLIVGLEERRQELIAHQPSLARVFDLVEIRPWSDDETAQFYTRTFGAANATVDPDALQTMVEFTGGLPVLAHEIGDGVWRTADRPVISAGDAIGGVLDAAEIIGRKLVEPQILQTVRSQRYRSILGKLADKPFEHTFRRGELLERLDHDETKVLDNFLGRMRKLGAIVPDGEAGRGGYRFVNHLHQLYFWIEGERLRRERAS